MHTGQLGLGEFGLYDIEDEVVALTEWSWIGDWYCWLNHLRVGHERTARIQLRFMRLGVVDKRDNDRARAVTVYPDPSERLGMFGGIGEQHPHE